MPGMNLHVFPKIGKGFGPGISLKGLAFDHSSRVQCNSFGSLPGVLILTGHLTFESTKSVLLFVKHVVFNNLEFKFSHYSLLVKHIH